MPKTKKPKTEVKKPTKTKKPSSSTAARRAGKKPVEEPGKYFEAVGRRKTSTARIRISVKGDKVFSVNQKPLNAYFPVPELQVIALSAFEKMGCLDKFMIFVRVQGGGIHSQAEAIRHAAARALVKFDPEFKKPLRRIGYLTRDPRMRERKKFGLKRARRAPQWAKR
ncbi:MAG: 30S ribosomal protein S9 [Candidatus Nealsonbacteria bacterium]|nr:30S ribosomal protein S9 [Candidatus Nealsonbacteria bacterium]